MNEQNFEQIDFPSGVVGAVESRIGGRSENQDSYLAVSTPLGPFVIVCDGMGGGPAGKTASSMAAEAMARVATQASASADVAEVLMQSAREANSMLWYAASKDPALRGMGTTCVGVLINAGKAYIVHVGDSRCYQLRNGRAIFRTADHSYVGELVRRGSMSEEEARNSNFSNVIMRAIGGEDTVLPEVDIVEIAPSDRFALMTDGIWGALPEDVLVELLAADGDPAQLVAGIAERVDSEGISGGGGHDNLTLAMIELPPVAKESLSDDFPSDDITSGLSTSDVGNGVTVEERTDWALSDDEDPEGGYVIDDDEDAPQQKRPFTLADKMAAKLPPSLGDTIPPRRMNSPESKAALTPRQSQQGGVAPRPSVAEDSAKNEAEVKNNSVDSGKKNSMAKPMIWGLCVILIGAVAFGAWQYFSNKNSAPIEASAAIVTEPEIDKAPDIPDPVEEGASANEGKAMPEAKSATDSESQKGAKPDAGKPKGKGSAQAELNEAKEILGQLGKEYPEKFSKKKDKDKFEKRVKEREAKLNEVKKLLESYCASLSDPSEREKVTELIKEIRKGPVSIDTNQAQPTQEAITEINRLIEKLTKI